jgi:hypothetical protein
MSQKYERLQCWYYSKEGLMMYAVEMPSCGIIFLQSSPKIGKDVEGILRFCLSSLKGCDVGISDGRDL